MFASLSNVRLAEADDTDAIRQFDKAQDMQPSIEIPQCNPANFPVIVALVQ
jgi:hypothetical protein